MNLSDAKNIKIVHNEEDIKPEYINIYNLLRNLNANIFKYYDFQKKEYRYLSNYESQYVISILKKKLNDLDKIDSALNGGNINSRSLKKKKTVNSIEISNYKTNNLNSKKKTIKNVINSIDDQLKFVSPHEGGMQAIFEKIFQGAPPDSQQDAQASDPRSPGLPIVGPTPPQDGAVTPISGSPQIPTTTPPSPNHGISLGDSLDNSPELQSPSSLKFYSNKNKPINGPAALQSGIKPRQLFPPPSPEQAQQQPLQPTIQAQPPATHPIQPALPKQQVPPQARQAATPQPLLPPATQPIQPALPKQQVSPQALQAATPQPLLPLVPQSPQPLVPPAQQLQAATQQQLQRSPNKKGVSILDLSTEKDLSKGKRLVNPLDLSSRFNDSQVDEDNSDLYIYLNEENHLLEFVSSKLSEIYKKIIQKDHERITKSYWSYILIKATDNQNIAKEMRSIERIEKNIKEIRSEFTEILRKTETNRFALYSEKDNLNLSLLKKSFKTMKNDNQKLRFLLNNTIQRSDELAYYHQIADEIDTPVEQLIDKILKLDDSNTLSVSLKSIILNFFDLYITIIKKLRTIFIEKSQINLEYEKILLKEIKDIGEEIRNYKPQRINEFSVQLKLMVQSIHQIFRLLLDRISSHLNNILSIIEDSYSEDISSNYGRIFDQLIYSANVINDCINNINTIILEHLTLSIQSEIPAPFTSNINFYIDRLQSSLYELNVSVRRIIEYKTRPSSSGTFDDSGFKAVLDAFYNVGPIENIEDSVKNTICIALTLYGTETAISLSTNLLGNTEINKVESQSSSEVESNTSPAYLKPKKETSSWPFAENPSWPFANTESPMQSSIRNERLNTQQLLPNNPSYLPPKPSRQSSRPIDQEDLVRDILSSGSTETIEKYKKQQSEEVIEDLESKVREKRSMVELKQLEKEEKELDSKPNEDNLLLNDFLETTSTEQITDVIEQKVSDIDKTSRKIQADKNELKSIVNDKFDQHITNVYSQIKDGINNNLDSYNPNDIKKYEKFLKEDSKEKTFFDSKITDLKSDLRNTKNNILQKIKNSMSKKHFKVSEEISPIRLIFGKISSSISEINPLKNNSDTTAKFGGGPDQKLDMTDIIKLLSEFKNNSMAIKYKEFIIDFFNEIVEEINNEMTILIDQDTIENLDKISLLSQIFMLIANDPTIKAISKEKEKKIIDSELEQIKSVMVKLKFDPTSSDSDIQINKSRFKEKLLSLELPKDKKGLYTKEFFQIPFTNIYIGYTISKSNNLKFNLFIKNKYRRIWETLFFKIPTDFLNYYKNLDKSLYFNNLDVKDLENIYNKCINVIIEKSNHKFNGLINITNKYCNLWYSDLKLKTDEKTYRENVLLEKIKKTLNWTEGTTDSFLLEIKRDFNESIHNITSQRYNSLKLIEDEDKDKIIERIFSIAIRDMIIYVNILSSDNESSTYYFINVLKNIVNTENNLNKRSLLSDLLSQTDIDSLKEYYYTYLLSIIKNETNFPIWLKPIKKKLYDFYNKTKGFPKNNMEFNYDLKKIVGSIVNLNFQEDSLDISYLKDVIDVEVFKPDDKDIDNIQVDTLEMLKINILFIFNCYKDCKQNYINNTKKIIERIDIIKKITTSFRFPNKKLAINYLFEKSSSIKTLNQFDKVFNDFKKNLNDLFSIKNNDSNNLDQIYDLLEEEYIPLIKNFINVKDNFFQQEKDIELYGGKSYNKKKTRKKSLLKIDNSLEKKLSHNKSNYYLNIGGDGDQSMKNLFIEWAKHIRDSISESVNNTLTKGKEIKDSVSEIVNNSKEKGQEITDSISKSVNSSIKKSGELIDRSSYIIKKGSEKIKEKSKEIDQKAADYIGNLSSYWNDFTNLIDILSQSSYNQVYSEVSLQDLLTDFVIGFDNYKIALKKMSDKISVNTLEILNFYLEGNQLQNDLNIYIYLFSLLKLIELFNNSFKNKESNDFKTLIFLKEIKYIFNSLLDNNIVERYLSKVQNKLEISHLLANYIYDIYNKNYINNKEFMDQDKNMFLKLEGTYPYTDNPKIIKIKIKSVNRPKIENQVEIFRKIYENATLNDSPKIEFNINGNRESQKISLLNTVFVPYYTDIGQYFADLESGKITKEQHNNLFDYIEQKFDEAKNRDPKIDCIIESPYNFILGFQFISHYYSEDN